MDSALHARADELARGGLDWILAQAVETPAGLGWAFKQGEDEPTNSIYHGTAGVITALLEGWRHFGDDRYADAALRGLREVEAGLPDMYNDTFYIGRAGAAIVLHEAGRVLNDDRAAAAAKHALALMRANFDGVRWGEGFELMLGNAGIGLAGLACGDLDFALLAAEPYVSTTEPTGHGHVWETFAGTERMLHKFGHGTLGIVYALAAIGDATGRADLVELATAGADDVVSRNEAGDDGFLVAHSDPPKEGSRQERYSFGWCAGPTGDAIAFRELARVTGDPQWTELVDRCWHTVTTSGLPKRMRPGFWDNNGRCCGTAGVLATAGDLMVERDVDGGFAETLVADLDVQATVDGDMYCWANYEYRDTPPELAPRASWGMGGAGIVRELMRWKRLTTGGDADYVIPLPDQPPARKAAA
ncbi:MAG TPA: lanthionine synthetase LanC family protein [Phytomonospora sp.]